METLVTSAAWQFKILYDGECPFCKTEIKWLVRVDRKGRLAVEDISALDFDPAAFGSTLPTLMGTIHGVFPDGRMTTGMETFRNAYRAVGLGWLLAPTGWPIFRGIFDWLYRIFAANRIKVGLKFGRKCTTDRCKH